MASSATGRERGTQTVRTYKRNRLGPGAATIGAVEIVNTTPHREPNAGSDLLVPLGASGHLGRHCGARVGVLAAIAGRGDVLRIVGVAFVGVLAVAWLWRLGVVIRCLSVVERVTQELDGEEPEADDPAHAMLENPNQARQTAGDCGRTRRRNPHSGAIVFPDALCGGWHV